LLEKPTNCVHFQLVMLSYNLNCWRDQYPERGLFQQLMDRLRAIVPRPGGFSPVLATELRS
jgi:hypothetical protein